VGCAARDARHGAHAAQGGSSAIVQGTKCRAHGARQEAQGRRAHEARGFLGKCEARGARAHGARREAARGGSIPSVRTDVLIGALPY
jgi:hypothetical protein